jgi:Mn2+/Fe2+ NRAMP family transporter
LFQLHCSPSTDWALAFNSNGASLHNSLTTSIRCKKNTAIKVDKFNYIRSVNQATIGVSKKLSDFLKTLGPGILFASTAIGVSHLVQSTQAGANYGLSLLWVVVMANLLKYPFFEYGSRYANATGHSIIDGYKRLGNWAIISYSIITLLTMFMVSATVGKVTAGFMQNLFGLSSLTTTTIILFLLSAAILFTGKYSLLDRLIKIIGSVLLLSTLIAFIATLINGPQGQTSMWSADWFPAGEVFLIALMGWMPTAVDLSTWNSLWTVERIKQTGYHPKMKETLLDFNFGYIISGILAVFFVFIGAFLLFGTSQEMANTPAQFGNDVVQLYTHTIGDWSYLIIASAAFSIMFGTCIAIFDGYGRSVTRIIEVTRNRSDNQRWIYRMAMLTTVVGAFIVCEIFSPEEFKQLVLITTTLSFVVAPLVAIMNVLLVRRKHIGELAPPTWLRVLGYVGIVYLIGFAIHAVRIVFNI